ADGLAPHARHRRSLSRRHGSLERAHRGPRHGPQSLSHHRSRCPRRSWRTADGLAHSAEAAGNDHDRLARGAMRQGASPHEASHLPPKARGAYSLGERTAEGPAAMPEFRFEPVQMPPGATKLRAEVRAFLDEEKAKGTFAPTVGA